MHSWNISRGYEAAYVCEKYTCCKWMTLSDGWNGVLKYKIKKESCRKMVYIITFYNVNIINTKINHVIRINDVFEVVIF